MVLEIIKLYNCHRGGILLYLQVETTFRFATHGTQREFSK